VFLGKLTSDSSILLPPSVDVCFFNPIFIDCTSSPSHCSSLFLSWPPWQWPFLARFSLRGELFFKLWPCGPPPPPHPTPDVVFAVRQHFPPPSSLCGFPPRKRNPFFFLIFQSWPVLFLSIWFGFQSYQQCIFPLVRYGLNPFLVSAGSLVFFLCEGAFFSDPAP